MHYSIQLLLGLGLILSGGVLGWLLASKHVSDKLNRDFGNSLRMANLYNAYMEYFKKERIRRSNKNE